jgi:predicted RecB family nuclease
MKPTAEIFSAFLKCPTKCYLRSTGHTGSGNAYADWVRDRTDAYLGAVRRRLLAGVPEAEVVIAPATETLKTATWRLALDLPVQASNGDSRLHAVEREPSQDRGRPAQLIPVRFVYLNKLTRDDRLLVAFDALLLSEVLGREVSVGKIIHGDEHSTLKVKTAGLAKDARKILGKMMSMLAAGSPPDLALIRHCGECEFRDRCREQAREKDVLSLLSSMTEKERKKLHSEGIFTLTQLSYTFRPRRRPKRLQHKREKYHHSLKALAIREKKIHIVGSPELNIKGTPVYFDVEGLPDREFYYLVGLRVETLDGFVQRSFWADDIDAEKTLWEDFIAAITEVENPVLIHYGSFETTFLKRMGERYGEPLEGSPAALAIKSAINILSFMFAQVYFPTYSNGLKEIAGWLGHSWSHKNPSGAQSIIWRVQWQESGQPDAKQNLITYNAEDCQGLQILTNSLIRLCSSDNRPNLENGADPKAVLAERSTSKDTLWPRFSSEIKSFEVINKAARWNYQRERVYIRTDQVLKKAPARLRRSTQGRTANPNKKINYQRDAICPVCGRKPKFVGFQKKTVFDIRFSRYGIRRWVVAYRYAVYWCRVCHKTLGIPDELKPWGINGRNLVMFIAFQIAELCIPQRTIALGLNRLIRLGLNETGVGRLKGMAADYYFDTRVRILEKLIKGNLIHADETPMVLKHKRGYVWVFASLHEVAYFYTETREGDFVVQALQAFKGVLVSDFYAPYDSLPCHQQKCLIHLMRDLNDAVMDHPYDGELKEIVIGFADLLRSIVQTIDRWGLKSRFLKRHLKDVDRFYRRITRPSYGSEAAQKCKERFVKNRSGLFTFLSRDGIPWNNNNAEHAIKAFARLRRAIIGLSTANGIEEYLILLSICQTCKYSGLDFLDFLLSGEKDIDAFAASIGRHRKQPSVLP